MLKRIVIVDDDNAILEVFQLVFKKAGFAVTLFNDGKLILANQFEEPDIFIIDKQLRGIDGLDLCRHLKNRDRDAQTPVIIFSASHRIENQAMEAGADEFLEKPFKTKVLLEMVDRLINAAGLPVNPVKD